MQPSVYRESEGVRMGEEAECEMEQVAAGSAWRDHSLCTYTNSQQTYIEHNYEDVIPDVSPKHEPPLYIQDNTELALEMMSEQDAMSEVLDSEPCMEECNTTTRVLLGLDSILRDKVNLEVEAFQQTIQQLLDEQLVRVQHLIKLSADFPSLQAASQCSQEAPEPSPTESGIHEAEGFHHHEDEATVDLRGLMVEEEDVQEEEEEEEEEEDRRKDKCLLQLFVQAAKITNVLTQREEFRIYPTPCT